MVAGCAAPQSDDDDVAQRDALDDDPTTSIPKKSNPGDEGAATKPIPVIDVILNTSRGEAADHPGDGPIRIDAHNATTFYYDVELRLQNHSEPVNIRLSWAFAEWASAEATITGTYEMQVAPVAANMSLPVTLFPDMDLTGEQGQLIVVLETDPKAPHAASSVGVAFE